MVPWEVTRLAVRWYVTAFWTFLCGAFALGVLVGYLCTSGK